MSLTLVSLCIPCITLAFQGETSTFLKFPTLDLKNEMCLPLPVLPAPFRISGGVAIGQIEACPRDMTRTTVATYGTAQTAGRGLPSLSGARLGIGARWRSKVSDCVGAVSYSPMEWGVILLLKPHLLGWEVAPEG